MLASKMTTKLSLLISVIFFLPSCALVLLTEPDEQALRVAANGGTLDAYCERCVNSSKRYSRINSSKRGSLRNIPLEREYEGLSSKSDAARTRSATSFGLMGKEAIPALSKLEHLAIHDKSKWVRRASVKSLGKIRENSSYNILKKASKDSDPYVRMSAEAALKNWPKSKSKIFAAN
jgi:hypothetical protein